MSGGDDDDGGNSIGDAKKVVVDRPGVDGGMHDTFNGVLKLKGDPRNSGGESVEGGKKAGTQNEDEASGGGTNNTFKKPPEAASGNSSGTLADDGANGHEPTQPPESPYMRRNIVIF